MKKLILLITVLCMIDISYAQNPTYPDSTLKNSKNRNINSPDSTLRNSNNKNMNLPDTTYNNQNSGNTSTSDTIRKNTSTWNSKTKNSNSGNSSTGNSNMGNTNTRNPNTLSSEPGSSNKWNSNTENSKTSNSNTVNSNNVSSKTGNSKNWNSNSAGSTNVRNSNTMDSTVSVNVPANISKAFTKSNPKSTNVEWSKSGNNYKAHFDLDSTGRAATYNSAGKVIETEKQITIGSLPTPVISYVNTNYNDAYIKKATKITSSNGKVSYSVKIKDTVLMFDANGKNIAPKE